MDLLVYRISKEKYIEDLSGEGARHFGGRWNQKGTACLYTASSRSLALLELLVHLPTSLLPDDLWIATIRIEFSDSKEQQHLMEKVKIRELPVNWRSYPAPQELSTKGTEWLRKKSSLVMQVPSVIIPDEKNYLINPYHSSFHRVSIIEKQALALDPRLER